MADKKPIFTKPKLPQQFFFLKKSYTEFYKIRNNCLVAIRWYQVTGRRWGWGAGTLSQPQASLFFPMQITSTENVGITLLVTSSLTIIKASSLLLSTGQILVLFKKWQDMPFGFWGKSDCGRKCFAALHTPNTHP